MKRKVPIINHRTWNAMIDQVSRRLPLRFVRTSRRWVHPWTIVPEWSDAAEQWVFRIRPGFVNGVEPEISTLAMLASERTFDRIEEETGSRPEKTSRWKQSSLNSRKSLSQSVIERSLSSVDQGNTNRLPN